MKTALVIFACLLLLFNGVGAAYGGFSMLLHPDGSGIGLSKDLLEQTPFSNYTIPGIVLLVANGALSFAALISLVAGKRIFIKLLLLQGIVLAGWLAIQLLLIKTISPFHFIMGAVALLLMGIAVVLKRYYARAS